MLYDDNSFYLERSNFGQAGLAWVRLSYFELNPQRRTQAWYVYPQRDVGESRSLWNFIAMADLVFVEDVSCSMNLAGEVVQNAVQLAEDLPLNCPN